MPQIDRHRERIVPIEFESSEQFQNSAIKNSFKLVLVTSGNAAVSIGDKPWNISSPCVLCLSKYDEVKILNQNRFASKSFYFEPEFLNNAFTFDILKHNSFTHLKDQHDSNLLKPF